MFRAFCLSLQGLIPVVDKELPDTDHRYCVCHIYTNMKTEHPGEHLRDL